MEWRVIPGFDDYDISGYGDVRRLTPGHLIPANGIVKTNTNTKGYPVCMLSKNGKRYSKRVNQLVALTFIGERPSALHEVAHWDGIKGHNHYTNLQWSTHQENMNDMVVHGNSRKGELNCKTTFTDADIINIREEFPTIRLSMRKYAKRLGISHSTLSAIIRLKSWSHIGRETVDTKAAEAAGIDLSRFKKVGDPADRLTVK